jgi:hypothetical protein
LFDGSQPSGRFPYNGKVTDYQCFDKREHNHVQTTMTAVLASEEGIPPHGGNKYVIKAIHHNYCKNDVHDSKGVGGPGCFSGEPGCSCNAHGQDPRSRKTDAAGTRLFRWLESGDPKYFESGLYYGIWVYFPQNYAMNRTSDHRFFNLLQMKAAIAGAVDPVWAIDVVNQTPVTVSPMRMVVSFNGHGPEGHPFLGPHTNSTSINHRFDLESSSPTIPVGKWFHIQVYFKQWPREVKPHRGRIAVWQDDKLMVDAGGPDDPEGGIWTKYGDDLDGTKKNHGVNQFSVNNYTNGAIPDPAVIYFDDMVISTAPIFPGTALSGKTKK